MRTVQLAALFGPLLLALSQPVRAQAEAPRDSVQYYSTEELALDCDSSVGPRRERCMSTLTGALHAFAYLSHTEPLKDVLCIPPMSIADVRVHFLSYAAERAAQIHEMLAGAAVADMLYEKYPCPAEAIRRDAARAKAAQELLNRHRPNNSLERSRDR